MRTGSDPGQPAAVAQDVRATSSGLLLPHLSGLTVAQTLEHVVRGHQRRTGLAANIVRRDLPAQAPLATKIALYRIVQEALNNAWRHAEGAVPTVTVTGFDDRIVIEVADSGPGFDPAVAQGSETHLGLVSMRERAESLGGQFKIDSSPGRGTRAIATLPLGVREALMPKRSTLRLSTTTRSFGRAWPTRWRAARFEVIGEGEAPTDAIRIAGERLPDVLLLDIAMPGGGIAR